MPLGETATLKPGDDRRQILIWRANAPCGPGGGGVLRPEDSAVTTLFVSYDFDPGAPPARITIDESTVIEPFGVIKFGTDKDTHEAEFDLRRGVWVSVTSIDGIFLVSYPKVADSLQPPLLLKVGVGRGTKASPGVSTVATRTLPVLDEGVAQIIPKFAISAILVAPGPAGAATLIQRLAPGGPIISVVPIGQLDMEAIPIAAGAIVWEVAGAPLGSRVQFNLALS